MAKSFDAYRLMSGQDDSILGVIWWDGKLIRTSDENLTHQLKNADINGKCWADGEKFFKELPSRFSSGYVYCKKTRVDEEGKEV